MSTAIKRDRRSALADAEAFRKLFAGCFSEWVFGGSLRRNRPECSDVEHVVKPRWEEIPGTDLFATPTRINLLMRRADELAADLTVQKHVYGETGFRWGPLYRGFDFRNHMHEIYSATDENFGMQISIRTGSADFSKKLVTGLLRNGRRNHLGNVWRCDPCTQRDPTWVEWRRCEKTCRECDGTGLKPVEIIPARTEEEYFALCGVPFVPPEDRG